ncbi:MAG: hypothetical protein ACE5FG_00420 [Myxococcota bacterium]
MEALSYGEGIYRRRVRMTASGDTVRAELEDDFHHFAVSLLHDGQRVRSIEGEAVRYPWTTCGDATRPLRSFEGLRLTTSLVEYLNTLEPRSHCTHLFDVASLAVTHAARGDERRQYDIEIPDRKENRTRARIARDGEEILVWEVSLRRILAPEPFAGRSLTRGFPEWAEATLDRELAEAAIVLRRACSISFGRLFPLDRIPRSNVLRDRMLGACYSFGPDIIEDGRRMHGTTLEFTHAPEELLAEKRSRR